MRPTQEEIAALLAAFEWMPERERAGLIMYAENRATKYKLVRPALRLVGGVAFFGPKVS